MTDQSVAAPARPASPTAADAGPTRSGRSSISSVHASTQLSGRDPVFARGEDSQRGYCHTRCTACRVTGQAIAARQSPRIGTSRRTRPATWMSSPIRFSRRRHRSAAAWSSTGCSNSPAGHRSHSKLVQTLVAHRCGPRPGTRPRRPQDSACTRRAWIALQRTASGELPARMGPVKWIPQKGLIRPGSPRSAVWCLPSSSFVSGCRPARASSSRYSPVRGFSSGSGSIPSRLSESRTDVPP